MSTIDTATCSHEHTVERHDDIPGPHAGRRVCATCGKHLSWLPASLTPTRAARFRLPFGRHRGRELRAIDRGGDRGYLEWAAVAWESHPAIVRRIQAYLESTRQ